MLGTMSKRKHLILLSQSQEIEPHSQLLEMSPHFFCFLPAEFILIKALDLAFNKIKSDDSFDTNLSVMKRQFVDWILFHFHFLQLLKSLYFTVFFKRLFSSFPCSVLNGMESAEWNQQLYQFGNPFDVMCSTYQWQIFFWCYIPPQITFRFYILSKSEV